MYCSVRDAVLMEAFDTPLAGLRHLGIDALELELNGAFEVVDIETGEKTPLATDAQAEAYRKHLDTLGVYGCSLLTACDFSSGTPAQNVKWLVRAVELAALLGTTNIRVDSHMSKEHALDFGARVALFATQLREVLDATSGISVALGIENHGHQGNNLAFQLNVYEAVGSERLGATLDTGNFYWRGYPLSEVYGILNILAPYTKHTHLKNIRYPEETREQFREAGWRYGDCVCPLGEGDIDHAHVLALLRKAAYNGDLCIEDEALGTFLREERVAVLERDVAHVARLLDAVP